MPFIKLNRINKGGDIVINSEHIMFIEIEGRSTTVHLTQNLLFSVEESPADVAELVERTESARFKNALMQPGAAPAAG